MAGAEDDLTDEERSAVIAALREKSTTTAIRDHRASTAQSRASEAGPELRREAARAETASAASAAAPPWRRTGATLGSQATAAQSYP
jgi:hypothetical protein